MNTASLLKRYEKILLIRIFPTNDELFSYVNDVLNQLRYCERKKLFPVVSFDAGTENEPSPFYEKPLGENSWDYYFEPVAGLTYDQIKHRLADSSDCLSEEHIIELDNDQIEHLNRFDPDSIYNYPRDYYAYVPPAQLDEWYAQQQQQARDLVSKYIKPKTHILAAVDALWGNHFNSHFNSYSNDHEVVGVHLCRPPANDMQNARFEAEKGIETKDYFEYLDRFISGSSEGRLFIAGDESESVLECQRRYSGRAVVGESFSCGDDSDGDVMGLPAYRLGEQALIDCLLLSRTDVMVCGASPVSEFAMYFNKDLLNVNLSVMSAAAKPSTAADLSQFFGKGKLFEGAILINLDSRSDRLETSLSELRRVGMHDWSVRMSAYKHENGAYGCSRSHIEAIRYARWKGWKSVVIFEDDLTMAENFIEDAEATLLDLQTRNWSLFQFGVMNINKTEPISQHLYRHRNGQACHAYAVHQDSYDFIIDNYVCDPGDSDIFDSKHMPFDEYVNNYFTQLFPCYASRKLLISQRAGFSDIGGVERNYQTLLEEKY